MLKRIKEDWNNYKIGIGAAALYLFLSTVIFGAACPSRILFQKNCPGCGLTRAAFYLVTFQWKEAWSNNAMIFPLALFLGWCGFFRYVKGKKVPFFYGSTVLLCISTLGYFLLSVYL